MIECQTCGTRVSREDISNHLDEHRKRTLENQAATETKKRIDLTISSLLQENASRERSLHLPAQPSGSYSPDVAICPDCKRLVPSVFMDQHKKEQHALPHLPHIRTAHYSFIILPSGTDWDYESVFEHYQKASRAHSFDNRTIDPTRIKQLYTLKPSLRRFGVNSWFGYAVYQFPFTERVVLECPVVGNATYVLWGNWEDKISLSKGELRHQCPGQYRRIVHAGDWLGEVKRALSRGGH